jgi:chromosome partitioning protein
LAFIDFGLIFVLTDDSLTFNWARLGNYMFTVTVVNSKGGAGKTTLSTNIASYYAKSNYKTALIDYDSQGSSTFWLKRRPESAPTIQSIAAYKSSNNVTRSWFVRPEANTQKVVVDSPSGLDVSIFRNNLTQSDAIIIPVLPSAIDIHAASHFIADLLLIAKVSKSDGRIAVLANRSRKNTLVYQQLEKFLTSLGITFITTLRDTQNYVKASEQGLGIFELDGGTIYKDIETWQPLLNWLEKRAQLSNDSVQTRLG